MNTAEETVNNVVVMRKMPGGGSARELKKDITNLQGGFEAISDIQLEKGNQAEEAKAFAYLVTAIKEQHQAIGVLRKEAGLLS